MPSAKPQQPLLRIDARGLGGRQPEAGGVEELGALDEAAVLGVGLSRRVRVRTVVPGMNERYGGNCKVILQVVCFLGAMKQKELATFGCDEIKDCALHLTSSNCK